MIRDPRVDIEHVILKGHALKEIYCYDSVSHKTHAQCECGWKGSFRSAFRAREAHRTHKLAIRGTGKPATEEK